METGKLYKIVYKDAGRDETIPRIKEMVYIGREGKLLEFFNGKRDMEEVINEEQIIRMEKVKEYGKNRFE